MCKLIHWWGILRPYMKSLGHALLYWIAANDLQCSVDRNVILSGIHYECQIPLIKSDPRWELLCFVWSCSLIPCSPNIVAITVFEIYFSIKDFDNFSLSNYREYIWKLVYNKWRFIVFIVNNNLDALWRLKSAHLSEILKIIKPLRVPPPTICIVWTFIVIRRQNSIIIRGDSYVQIEYTLGERIHVNLKRWFPIIFCITKIV